MKTEGEKKNLTLNQSKVAVVGIFLVLQWMEKRYLEKNCFDYLEAVCSVQVKYLNLVVWFSSV